MKCGTNEKEPTSHEECNRHVAAIGDALYAIGGKWKLRILVSLRDSPMRFNELQRMIEGISAKVLSSELKELELNGFIKRNVYDKTPVVVEYEATPYTQTLREVIGALSDWGIMHREKTKKDMQKQRAKAKQTA